MLLRNVTKYFRSAWVYHREVAATQQNQMKKFSKSCYVIKEEKLLSTRTTSIKTNRDTKRFYTDGVDECSAPKVFLPPLNDDDPLHTLPHPLHLLQGGMHLKVINKEVDKEFNMAEFCEGSKQAMLVVSDALAREDYDSLTDLVYSDTIDKLREKISTLSQEQKDLIRVHEHDIIGGFPYEAHVYTNGHGENVTKVAEITMVFQTLKGRHQLLADGDVSLWRMLTLSGSEYRLLVCNYTFRKEYKDGSDGPWMISKCNHFSPMAH